jgi:hypothetical protein
MLHQSPLAATLFRLVEEPASFENRKICFLTADLLIRHGADPNWIIDKKQGLSLLLYFCGLKVRMNKAQKQLSADILRFLLEKGADSHQTTLDDRTAEDLLQSHCNKEELLAILKAHREKLPEPKPEFKPIKRISADFFKLPPKA